MCLPAQGPQELGARFIEPPEPQFLRHWLSFCFSFYAPQLYRQVLLRRVLAMGILSVRHDPVRTGKMRTCGPGDLTD